jgi:hypothetical protein
MTTIKFDNEFNLFAKTSVLLHLVPYLHNINLIYKFYCRAFDYVALNKTRISCIWANS